MHIKPRKKKEEPKAEEEVVEDTTENSEDKKIEYTLNNREGKDYLHYEWLELDKLDNYNLVPKAIKNILNNKKFPIHVINNELK